MDAVLGIGLFALIILLSAVIGDNSRVFRRYTTFTEVENAARGLGLASCADGFSGVVRGVQVDLRLGQVTTVEGYDVGYVAYAMTCTARLEPPLRLGLEMQPKKGYFGRRSNGFENRIGTSFAAEFHARALESELAERVLKDTALRLARANLAGWRPVLADSTLECSHAQATHRELPELVRTTTSLAHALVSSRARLPPSELETTVRSVFGEIAAELGGKCARRRLRFRANVDGGRIRGSLSILRGPKWRTRIELVAARPFTERLVVVSRATAPKRSTPNSNVHQAFDASFSVEADDGARPAVTDAVRRALLALRDEVHRVRVDERRVRADVYDAVADVGRFRRIIARLCGVTEAMHAAPAERGPYR